MGQLFSLNVFAKLLTAFVISFFCIFSVLCGRNPEATQMQSQRVFIIVIVIVIIIIIIIIIVFYCILLLLLLLYFHYDYQ